MVRGILAIIIVLGIAATSATGEELFDTKASEELFNTGLALYDTSDFHGAIGKFDQAIQINPENTDAYYFIGYSYYKLNNMDKAMDVFEQAYEIDSKYSPFPRRPQIPPPTPGTLSSSPNVEIPGSLADPEGSSPSMTMEASGPSPSMEVSEPSQDKDASDPSSDMDAPAGKNDP